MRQRAKAPEAMGDSAVRAIPATASKASIPEPTRTGLAAETLQRAVVDNLTYIQARLPEFATPHDWYMALAYTVRDRMLERWQATVRTDAQRDVKVVCYLSAEFLIGPQLGNNLLSLDIAANARAAMAALDQDLDKLLALEEEPGLGNGGLGRLAACYMDSLATLELPAIGYGIRYEFGIFDQQIRGGAQVEVTDKWLQKGNPWEIVHTELSRYVSFGGHSETFTDADGHQRVRWVPAHMVKGVPCDTPCWGITSAPATRCDSGRVRPSSRSISRTSTPATTTGPLTIRSFPRPSRRCCIRMMRLRPASVCASLSSTFSSPARCRTCCACCTSKGHRWPPCRMSLRCS